MPISTRPRHNRKLNIGTTESRTDLGLRMLRDALIPRNVQCRVERGLERTAIYCVQRHAADAADAAADEVAKRQAADAMLDRRLTEARNQWLGSRVPTWDDDVS